jgi:hypothetical protein
VEASGARIEPGRVIGEAFETYQQNAGPLLGGAVVVLGGAALANGLLATTESLILILAGAVISLVAQFLYTGFVVRLVEDVRDGRRDHTVGDLFEAAWPAVPTLILNGILYGIAVVIGFILLIVPGLILITIWAVVAPVIVVERTGAIEAFGRSRNLVRGNGWQVFWTILLAFLIIVFANIVLSAIGAAIADEAGSVIFNVIASVLLVPIAGLVASILYFDLGGGQAPAAPAPGVPPAEQPPPSEPPPAA